jgi:DNA sulfur modification protein DndC
MSNENSFIYKSHLEMLNDSVIAGQPLNDMIDIIQETYGSDNRPWIIGFSGGKDSTTILSLIYSSLLSLPVESRTKHIYVVSSDTLVETPVVVDMINRVLDTINHQAKLDSIPMTAHPVYPKMDQTFWVNLLGRGYPAPKQSFRWCTERMKIDPVSSFITEKVANFGEVVVVLGSRKEESSSRAQVINKHKIEGSALSRHTSLPNAYTYMPIENWTADEVWAYLLSAPCPWGGDNQKLFELYKGSNQGECPLVIDTSTPSCGNSRFGCWTCTVVNEDKALHGLIESGETWMQPLLDFRNVLYETTDPDVKEKYRNFKRRTGKVHYRSLKEQVRDSAGNIVKDENGNPITKREPAKIENMDSRLSHGPYWLKYRKEWLKKLLEIEKVLAESGHEFKLISIEELQSIRQQWLRDPNEPDWADSLPSIYDEVYDTEVDWIENDAGAFTEPDAKLLSNLSSKHNIPAELVMKLIEVELSVSGLGNRRGILQKLETVLKKDWGSLEEINTKNLKSSSNNLWKDEVIQLQDEYKKAQAL